LSTILSDGATLGRFVEEGRALASAHKSSLYKL
jgi:hypothetical protein